MTDVLSPNTNSCEHCDPSWTMGSKSRHERTVKHLLDTWGFVYTHNRRAFDGTLRRPDFVLHVSADVCIIIEVDEQAHRSCDDDVDRMKELDQQSTQPIVFIRFNPDANSCPREEQHGVLRQAIRTAEKQTSSQVVYLFYPNLPTGEFKPLDQIHISDSRKCSVCNDKKPPSHFTKMGARKCTQCNNEGYTKRHTSAVANGGVGGEQGYICSHTTCDFDGQVQPISQFPISKGTSRATICRACKNADSAANMAKKRRTQKNLVFTLATLPDWQDQCKKQGWGKRRPRKQYFDSQETYTKAGRIWELNHIL